MLTIAPIRDAGRAGRYFEGLARSDRQVDPATGAAKYFQESGEPPGRWRGDAAALGKRAGDIVKVGELEQVLNGYHPETGEFLPQHQPKAHRPGWDLTFATPKTVSAIWAVADPEVRAAIERAHEAAVGAAMDYLQANAAFTRRGQGGQEAEPVRLIAVEYQHSASRAQDPHLHSHLLVMNLALRADGTWGTIESRWLYQHRQAAGHLYQAELAARLRALGFAIQRGRGATFEVAGVPPALRAAWSQRHAQMAAHGATGQSKAAEWAFQKDRPEKARVNRAALFERWGAEALAHGLEPAAIRHALEAGRSLPQHEEPAVDWAALRARMTEDRSTFRPEDLVRAVASRMYGAWDAARVQAEVAAALADPEQGFVALGTDERGPLYTTQEHLDRERRMLEALGRLAGAATHAADPRAVERAVARDRGGWRLSPEQADAVRALAGGSRLGTVRGAAGTGKTSSMIALREAYEASGYRLIGAATSNAAARVLGKEARIKSYSIAKLLYELASPEERYEARARLAWEGQEAERVQAAEARGEEPGEPRPFPGLNAADRAWLAGPGRARREPAIRLDSRTVVLVDEAAMADTAMMAKLVEHVERSGAKLVMIGDERQIQAVGAGGGFAAARQIARQVGSDAELREGRRQKIQWQKEAAERISLGQAQEALQLYEREGRLMVEESPEAAARRLVEDWARDRLLEKGTQLILASTHAQGAVLNRLAQAALKARGLLGPAVAEGESDRQGRQTLHQGDEVIFTQKQGREGQGWINGDRGVVVGARDGKVLVRLEGGRIVGFDPRRFRGWRLAYAATAHKSQGATVDRAYYYLSSMDRRELGYVATSRHRRDLRIYADRTTLGVDPAAERARVIAALARGLSKSDQKRLALEEAARARERAVGHER